MKKSLLKKYAKLVAQKGVSVEKNQPVRINASIESHEFVEMLVEACYKAGASKVVVDWSDDVISKAEYKYMKVKDLCEVPEYVIAKSEYFVEKRFARVSISSKDPDSLKGVNLEKLRKANIAFSSKLEKYSEPYMASKIQWCVIAIPNYKWAKKVFPQYSKKKAFEELWKAILACSRVTEDNDPVVEWENHDQRLLKYATQLNEYNFKALKYQSSNGTDFTIELAPNHIWAGGAEANENGTIFNPNIPTEEVFTMPLKTGVNGKVVSTKPLSVNGNLVENFSLTFKDGRVEEFSAEKGYDVLESLLNTDEGARRLGEVALVPYNSPISQSNILFYNTLFDENASCHLALGRAYSMNVKGGPDMSKEELSNIGANQSFIHVDFMIGAKDLSIVGITQDNKEIPVFINGDWAI